MRWSHPLLIAGLAVAFAAGAAEAGNPWEELMGPGKPTMWHDPAARFSIGLPLGWKPVPGDREIVRFSKHNTDHRQSGFVSVEMRPVPSNVRLAHFALRVAGEMKAAAPNYRVLSQDKITIASTPARRTHFTYQEQGNAQLANEAVQIVFVTGEQAWIITLLTANGARPLFWEDYEKMLKYFVPRGGGDQVIGTKKKRRKLKAGEMVNPDMIKY